MATATSVEVQELRENTGVTLHTKLYFTYNVNYSSQQVEITNCYMSAWKSPDVSTVISTPQTGSGNWTWRVYSPEASASGKTYGDYTYNAQVRTSEVYFYTSSGTTNKLSFNIPFSNITWGGTSFSFTLAGRLMPPSYSTWASNDNNRPEKTITTNCPTYTVQYNMNGGSGSISSQTKYYNKSLTLSSTKPTRSGYTFKGWSTSSSATAPTYYSGGTYNLNAGNILYAVWSYDGDYDCTVSYKIDPNQSGISISSSTYSYSSAGDIYKDGSWYYDWIKDNGSSISILATSAFGLSRTGYTLAGTYHAESNPSLSVAGSSSKTYSQLSSGMITREYSSGGYYKSIYLVIDWTPRTYTVTLDRQSGSGGSSSVTATYDSSMPSITKPTRTGYIFQGYYSQTNGQGTKYYNSSGTSVRTYNIANSTTLYAYWEPIEYSIAYSLNGGEFTENGFNKVGETGNPVLYNPQGSIEYDSGFYKIDKPKKTGYAFNYFKLKNLTTSTAKLWYSEDGSSSWHSPSSSTVSLTSSQSSNLWIQNLRSSSGTVTITAYYTANTFTVTLNKQNGSGGSSSVTATYGSAMPSINIPSKSGYSFGGYYTNTGGSGTQYYNASGASVRNWDLTSDTTLYAYWIDNDPPSNTVSGGYNKKATSQTVTLSATDNEGVTKYYWGTSSTGSMSTTYSGSITQTVSSSGTRYFRTKDAAGNTASTPVEFIQYKVQNVLQKSSGTAGTYTSANYETNGNLNTYIIRPTTTYPDYIYNAPSNSTFKGWSTSFSTSKANLSTSQISLSSGTTYYMWFDRDTYTVQYNNNGGSGTMENSIATYGANFITRPNTFTKSGYSFNGWNESADGTGVPWKLTSSGVYENENGAHPWVWTYTQGITLYAQWVVNEKPGVHINVSGLFQLAAPYIFCKRGTETTASWHKMAPYVWDGTSWRLCGETGAVAQVIKFTSISIDGSSTVATGNGTEYTITASPSDATNQQVVVTVSGDGYFGTNTSTKTQTVVLSGGSGTVIIKSNAQGTTSTGTITARPVVADSDSVSASKSVTYAANVVKFSTIIIEGDDTVTSGTTYTVRATPANATNQNVTITITGPGYLGTTVGTTSQTITLSGGVGTFKITSTAQNTNGSGTITATPAVAATSGLKATKNITYSATIVKFSTITIEGNNTVTQNGTTYTISASPTNAANQSVTVSLTGNGYFDSNTGTTSKNITLVNGTKTVVISSKAGTAGTQGVITATPAVAQTSGLKATKNVTYEATKFTTITVSPDNEQTIAYHGTKTFTVTATPSYAGPQYVYLYDATASAGYTSISGTGITAGSYTLNSQNTSAVCQYKLTLTNGVGSFIVTNNSSSTADEHGAVFVYTVLPSSTNTVELSTSTGILTLSKNPDAQFTLQSFSDAFDIWRTGSTVNSRWLYANTTTAVPTNTNLPVLSDSDTTTGIQVQGKSWIAGGTADVDLDLTLQNAVLTHTPEEINTINIICQTTMTNGSTTNYYSFKVTMNNQESSVISDLTSSNGRVSTYAPSVSFTDAQKTAIVNAIKSSSNGKTFSLVNTVHGHANYTFSGTVNVQLLSLSIVIGYKAYA